MPFANFCSCVLICMPMPPYEVRVIPAVLLILVRHVNLCCGNAWCIRMQKGCPRSGVVMPSGRLTTSDFTLNRYTHSRFNIKGGSSALESVRDSPRGHAGGSACECAQTGHGPAVLEHTRNHHIMGALGQVAKHAHPEKSIHWLKQH